MLRLSAVVLTVLSGAFLVGCSAQKSITAVHVDRVELTSPPSFSLNTPVEKIAANQHGKAILDHDVPGLMASRSYILVEDMSLSQIATVSGGRLTKAKLDLVEADLSRLSAESPGQ